MWLSKYFDRPSNLCVITQYISIISIFIEKNNQRENYSWEFDHSKKKSRKIIIYSKWSQTKNTELSIKMSYNEKCRIINESCPNFPKKCQMFQNKNIELSYRCLTTYLNGGTLIIEYYEKSLTVQKVEKALKVFFCPKSISNKYKIHLNTVPNPTLGCLEMIECIFPKICVQNKNVFIMHIQTGRNHRTFRITGHYFFWNFKT